MTEKILVTGGAGFIGSHVCEALLTRGDNVICIDNFHDYYPKEIKEKNISKILNNKNFKLYNADICDSSKMKEIIETEKPAKVIHLAAIPGVRNSIKNPGSYVDTNINGTLNLLEVFKNQNIKNFVFGSSSSVYGVRENGPFLETDCIDKMISPYAITKRAGELFCYQYHALYNIPITCLRFFTAYGPRNRPDMAIHKFIKAIKADEAIDLYGTGEQIRDYTFVSDIVDGVIKAADKPLGFETINLGGGKKIKLIKLIHLIADGLYKKANINFLPPQKGDVPFTFAGIDKAKKLIDWTPKTSLEDGIQKTIEYFRDA